MIDGQRRQLGPADGRLVRLTRARQVALAVGSMATALLIENALCAVMAEQRGMDGGGESVPA
jgi:hypothetical protein